MVRIVLINFMLVSLFILCSWVVRALCCWRVVVLSPFLLAVLQPRRHGEFLTLVGSLVESPKCQGQKRLPPYK